MVEPDGKPDVRLDVTAHWNDKLQALKLHASQIDPRAFEKRMLERAHSHQGKDFYVEEGFRRIIFRRISG